MKRIQVRQLHRHELPIDHISRRTGRPVFEAWLGDIKGYGGKAVEARFSVEQQMIKKKEVIE